MSNDNSSAHELLQGLGFTPPQSRTYLAMLELEAVSIRKIAEHTGINRGTTYEILKQLVTAGLVTLRRSGQREYYVAESPERLHEIIRDKRKELWRAQQLSQKVIPSLLSHTARPSGRPLVRYYEAEEGVVAILHDVLQTCRSLDAPEYYVYSSRRMRQFLYRKFPSFTDRRISEGITVKVIAVGEGGELAAGAERKWLPEPTSGSVSSYTIIYGQKVAHISIAGDYTPFGVVIEDEGTAHMQQLLFEQLWQTL